MSFSCLNLNTTLLLMPVMQKSKLSVITHIQMALIGDVNRKTFVFVATLCHPGG